jgi:hypothetical protein
VKNLSKKKKKAPPLFTFSGVWKFYILEECLRPPGMQSIYNMTQALPQNAMQDAAPPTAPAVPLFGLVCPGRSILTDFRQISETKYAAVLANPAAVTDVAFFLLPAAQELLATSPAAHAVVLYFAIAPYTNWQTLGSLDRTKPSGIFRTGWPTNVEVAASADVQIGISVESAEVVANLGISKSGVDERKIAMKVAQDLQSYMSSFAQQVQNMGEMLVLPANVVDRWIERFEQKFNRDPSFLMK